jgi:serine/threonine protein kinase
MASGRTGASDPLRRVGHYEIIREIGRGGMARVHLARQLTLGREVALKELNGLGVDSPELAARFLRESQLAGSLSHPNIVVVHEYFEVDTVPYIAMEYVPRGSLRSFMDTLDLPAFAGVMEGVLAGLAHAAGRAVVHRDLKPENIMVGEEGRAKIADFGIAKATEITGTSSSFATNTGVIVGTPRYMAPEQIMGKEIGIWTDLYSLGVVAYEFTTGRVPFDDSEVPTAILMRHLNEEIPPPIALNPSIDPELSAWVRWLLEKDPADRARDPLEAWDRLEDIVLRLCGPRWRRTARLSATSGGAAGAPLTPAPFESPSPVNDVQTVLTGSHPVAAPITGDEPTPRRPETAPAPTPGSPSADHSRRRRGLIGSVLGALVAAAVVVGFLLGHSGHAAGRAPAGTATVSAGHVGVRVPVAWVTASDRAPVPGLPLTGALGRRDPRSGGVLVAGLLRGAGGRLLLPPGFLSSLARAPRADDAVRLGAVSAYRYRDLTTSGSDRRFTIFVVPSRAGVLSVVCSYRPAARATFLDACERAAATLRVTGTESLPLGPVPAYAHALGLAARRLQAARPTVQALRHATTRHAQSALCAHLASIQTSASRAVSSVTPGPDAASLNSSLLSALHAAAAGYRSMSKAAQSGGSRAYDSARSETVDAVRRGRHAIIGLRSLGYGATKG